MVNDYFTNKAVDDLTDIWNYTIEIWSQRQAEKQGDLLLVSCNELAKKPKLGNQYDIINSGIWGYKSGEHIIFYSIVSKIEI